MAAAAVQNEKLKELLQCSVCIDVFTDPRTLPCLHTFCFKCIVDWCKDKPGKMPCPECREECTVPESGLVGLKKNFFIANLLGLSMNEMQNETKKLCETCFGRNNEVADMFCLQCDESYCKSCSITHNRMKISSSHKIVPLDEVHKVVDRKENQHPINSIYCDKHTDRQIELYCLEDEVAVCIVCRVLEHRSHQCENIKKVVEKFLARRQEKLQTATSKVDGSIEVLSSRKQSFFDQIKCAETEICEEADKRMQMIANHKQKLLSELHEIKTNRGREIESLTQEFANAKSLLTEFTNHCDKLFKEGSDVSICREEGGLRRRTEELINKTNLDDGLKKLNVPVVIFSSSSDTFENTTNVLGQVKADNPELVVTLKQPPTFRHSGDRRAVMGVTMLENYLFVVYREYNKVEVFDCQNRFKKSKDIEIQGMKQPNDIVGSIAQAQLFMCEWHGEVVWRVDLNTEVGDAFIKLGLLYNASLSLAENRLLVSSSHSIVIYDIRSGEKIKNISLTGDIGEYSVRHAIESNRGSFFVSHGSQDFSTISEIDSEGRVIRVFNNEECIDCGYMALDSVGRLLVTDLTNGRVVLLDEHLIFKRIILDYERPDNARPEFGRRPYRLDYNKDKNRLAVGLENGHVKIFE